MYGNCFLSGRFGIVERHHIFGGARRDLSERYGLVVFLSPEKHQLDRDAAHRCGETADKLHRYGQRKAMLEQGWTVEQFRLVFGKNYLDAAELEALERERKGIVPLEEGDTSSVSSADTFPSRGRLGFRVLEVALPF